MSVMRVRAAVVQLQSRQDVAANLAACAAAAAEAADRGARLCALPENFAFMGPERGKLGIADLEKVLSGASPCKLPGEKNQVLRWLKQPFTPAALPARLKATPEEIKLIEEYHRQASQAVRSCGCKAASTCRATRLLSPTCGSRLRPPSRRRL